MMSGVTRTSVGLAEESVQADEAQGTQEFIAFLREASLRRHPHGPIRRFNQGRHTACVEAEFTVADSLPPELRVGLFSEPRTWAARIRFANAASASDRERDTRGMSIRLLGVAGENLTPGADVHDFILNSHPVMMTPGPRDFLQLLRAMETGVGRARFFLTHPRAAFIAIAARQNPTSHLDIPYWSTTPYLFGSGRAVKYIVRPCSATRSTLPRPLTDGYLREAMTAHLASTEACFDFLVQFQTSATRTPIEDATVEWKERDAPYRAVARIRIPPQRLDDPEREAFCEQAAFNPWHALAEHRPLGAFNRARRDIYRAMAELRSERRRTT
jgi:hypothetical protein